MWVFFSSDCTVREWDLLTMTSVRVLQGHKGPIRDVKVRMTYLFYTLLFVGFVLKDIICTYGKKVCFFVLIPIALLAISVASNRRKERKNIHLVKLNFSMKNFRGNSYWWKRTDWKKGRVWTWIICWIIYAW